MNSKFGNFSMRQFMVKIMRERERERKGGKENKSAKMGYIYDLTTPFE